jgi:hypothetical protein
MVRMNVVLTEVESHLPEMESVGRNVVKHRFLLLLDRFPESADGLGTLDLHREDVPGIVTKYDTVHVEVMMSET